MWNVVTGAIGLGDDANFRVTGRRAVGEQSVVSHVFQGIYR